MIVPRSAFIYHVYFMDLARRHLPLHCIVAGRNRSIHHPLPKIRFPRFGNTCNSMGFHQATFIPVINRGRDVSALLVAACPVVLMENMTSLVSLMIRNPVRIRKMDIMAPRAKRSRVQAYGEYAWQ